MASQEAKLWGNNAFCASALMTMKRGQKKSEILCFGLLVESGWINS
jgi:hypothetical protein